MAIVQHVNPLGMYSKGHPGAVCAVVLAMWNIWKAPLIVVIIIHAIHII